jgi:hypothetical protein
MSFKATKRVLGARRLSDKSCRCEGMALMQQQSFDGMGVADKVSELAVCR